MNAPYDAAAELTKLAASIDERLDNELADRQLICEDALARIKKIVQAMTTTLPAGGAEAAARQTAAAALLADYQRDAQTADTADRAMWGARLADTMASVLAAWPTTSSRQLPGGYELVLTQAMRDAIAWCEAHPENAELTEQGRFYRATAHELGIEVPR